MVNSLLQKFDSEERLAPFDNFTNGTKKIAEEYILELHSELITTPEEELNERQTTEKTKEETPIEKTIKKWKDILVEFELRYSEIEDAIKERINPDNHDQRLDRDRDYVIEEVNDMKRNLDDIKNMIHEIIQDIQEIQETQPNENRLDTLKNKRKEYHNIVKNYPPIT